MGKLIAIGVLTLTLGGCALGMVEPTDYWTRDELDMTDADKAAISTAWTTCIRDIKAQYPMVGPHTLRNGFMYDCMKAKGYGYHAQVAKR